MGILNSGEGKYSLGLTDIGVGHANAAANALAKITTVDKLYTSPAIRAQETAQIIGKRLNLEPKVDPQLQERFWGKMIGMKFKSHEESLAAYKAEVESGYKAGMESWELTQHRIIGFVNSVHESTVIAITHADLIMAMLGVLDPKYDEWDSTTDVPYASITALDMEKKSILCIGSRHLPETLQR